MTKKTDLYQNKYRIPSTRLKNWDYGANAAYFITICTKNRAHYFGEVTDGEMKLSEIGKIANKFWAEIPEHFPFIELGAFIIMPNHTHGILILNKKENLSDLNHNEEFDVDSDRHSLANSNFKKDSDANFDPNKKITLKGIINPDKNLDSDRKIDPNGILDSDYVQTLQCNVSTGSTAADSTAFIDIEKTLQCNVSTPNIQMQKIAPKAGSISTIIRSYKSATTKHARNIDATFGWQSLFHDHIIRSSKAFNNIQQYINNPKNWDADTFYKS